MKNSDTTTYDIIDELTNRRWMHDSETRRSQEVIVAKISNRSQNWTITNAGVNAYYLQNAFGAYVTYHDQTYMLMMTENSANKTSFEAVNSSGEHVDIKGASFQLRIKGDGKYAGLFADDIVKLFSNPNDARMWKVESR